MDLQYRHVEAALATVCDIAPNKMGAFRARLRHLRNIGLARLPKPGSGQPILYAERQVLEMLIALELETHGYLPRNAAFIAQSIVRQSPYGQHEGGDCFIIVDDPQKANYIQAVGQANLAKALKTGAARFLVINVSAHVKKLSDALNKATKRG
jgi:hypothetical protein